MLSVKVCRWQCIPTSIYAFIFQGRLKATLATPDPPLDHFNQKNKRLQPPTTAHPHTTLTPATSHKLQPNTYKPAALPTTTQTTHKNLHTTGRKTMPKNSLKDKMWAGQSNILVAVRVRDGVVGPKTLKVMNEKLVIAKDPKEFHKKNVLRSKRSREKQYAFDYAFGPETNSTKVYESTTQFLIDGVLNGYNATVFAYGATGAGKTFTMLGTDTEPGIMVLTLRDLFSNCRRIEEDPTSGIKYKITISYLEVYNELIRDLLTPSGEFLDLREDPIKGPTVAGLSEVHTTSTDEVMRLLQKGNKRRTQEATAANAESSRSHAVLQVSIEKRNSAEGTHAKVQVGKLSMIDLAGSERASVTKNRGKLKRRRSNVVVRESVILLCSHFFF